MTKKRLGEMLLEAGIIDEHKLQAALGHQRKWGGRLGRALVDLKLATEPQIVSALSRKFGYQPVPPQALDGGPMLESAMRLVPREFASRHNLMPFAMDSSTIWVAMSDPANIAVVDELRFRTGRRVQVALAGDREIAEAVRRHFFVDRDSSEVKPIPFEADADSAPPETVVEQFGGGSTAAFEDFFARPPEAAPVAAPEPTVAPVSPPDPVDGASLPPIDLEDLLSEEAPAPQPFSPAEPTGGQPQAGAQPVEAQGDPDAFDLPLEEVEPEWPAPGKHAVLEALDCLVQGEWVAPEVVKPAQMVAALVRLLLQKKIISEEEFLAEFQRK